MITQQILTHAADMLLAAPTPEPTPGGEGGVQIVNTGGILTFFTQMIAPIIIGIIGVVILARAKSGNVSSIVNTSGIALVGLAFLGGAGALVFLGDDIVRLVVGG